MEETMKAWRVHEYGPFRESLRWEECPRPVVLDEGVVIKIKASALNFPDLLAIAGKYQVRAPLPFVPGLEAAGEVVQTGPNSRFKVGDRVVTMALWGAFGSYISALDSACFAIPESMSEEEAAAAMIVYQTGYFALVYRAALQPGEVLLVHGGAGGVGTAAIQLGKALGATVIATAGSKKKLQVCRDCGADHTINYREDDFVRAVKKFTNGKGADVIFDPVGGEVFDNSTRCISFGGRLVVIGFASGRIPEIKANRILLKNMSVIGLFWGNYQLHNPALIHTTHRALADLYNSEKIKPVICETLPQSELKRGLELLETRQSYGKVVLVPA